jgi:hypothetical protein
MKKSAAAKFDAILSAGELFLDKNLKKRVIALFTAHMQAELPSFVPFTKKSEYFFSAEKVWEDTSIVPGARLYIIFSPEFNGRDQFSIELGWSKLHRFPQVLRRPSLSFESEFRNCHQLDEATARLPKIISLHFESWIDINAEKMEEVMAEQFRMLIEYGIPFLKKIEER